uniref:Thyroid hormone receptor interactor 10a n=1 Tax=Gadus morhua TaxID=8049 RepID=A0A8C5B1E6_GADMO
MDWGTDLWDQYDIIEKHTLSGLDLVEKYVKFVKERTEIEQNYAKQLRNLSKKYYPKRGSKDETECRFQSFTEILNEMNDYAGQRELVAEDMMMNICIELTKYLQELKQERKTYLLEAKKAQQTLEVSYKQLDSSKKRFEREWREAERSAAYAEKTDQDINATKADVGKAKQQAHMRSRIAEECKNDYAAQLQKCNKEQNQFYFNDMPVIFNKLQDMDERRGQRLADGYVLFSDTEKHVMPIIDKCLEGIHKAGCNVNQRNDSLALVEQHKSGFERPGDIEFEDYSQGINRTSSDSSLSTPKGPLELLGKNRNKKSWLLKKSKPTVTEDFGHLPPEQRRKRLQKKRDEIAKELQKEVDQSEALEKMRDVYEKNPQMGDPASLAPQNRLIRRVTARGGCDSARLETKCFHIVSCSTLTNVPSLPSSPDGAQSDEGTPDHSQAIYAEFDDDFEEEEEEEEVEEEEPTVAIGNCTAMYNFPGASEGTISMQEGEVLDVVEEDKGDGWTRVRRTNGDEGYIPTSYVSIKGVGF